MICLSPYRSDLETIKAITDEIESHVKKLTAEELEGKNKALRRARVPAYKYEDFIRTSHNETLPFPPPTNSEGAKPRILNSTKVLELCRIIAGLVIGRILTEYGADVIKIPGPNLSDVPFFQIDVNMGKHTAELDLKTPEGKVQFEKLLEEADGILNGYRPGEWAYRAGWQQIANTVTGIAWAQGHLMGLDTPAIPPFPISDYSTGCMGAIAALTGLYHRATTGGSWHGKASLIQYDLILFAVGQYTP
ncbi:hypothetical protein FQN52_008700 [Onygenales sp. PD_12]|nr:hypothetical protein FQN52_008700 [Onygenales sp. PD_12]